MRNKNSNVSPLIASPPCPKGSVGLVLSTEDRLSLYSDFLQDIRRRSDVNSQTNSRLFELSPILEDAHVVDRHLGSAESAENGRPDRYDSETSDSSLGSLLDFQVSADGVWIMYWLILSRKVFCR